MKKSIAAVIIPLMLAFAATTALGAKEPAQEKATCDTCAKGAKGDKKKCICEGCAKGKKNAECPCCGKKKGCEGKQCDVSAKEKGAKKPCCDKGSDKGKDAAK